MARPYLPLPESLAYVASVAPPAGRCGKEQPPHSGDRSIGQFALELGPQTGEGDGFASRPTCSSARATPATLSPPAARGGSTAGVGNHERKCNVNWRPGNIPLPESNLAGIALGIVLQRIRPVQLPGSAVRQRIAGGVFVGGGGWILLRSVRAAASIELAQPDGLVTSGPYAVVRNPMYVGWSLLHLGIGVASGSGWIVATLPAAAAVTHREVQREEQRLGEAFPDEFRRYREVVPAYLPGKGRALRAALPQNVGNVLVFKIVNDRLATFCG